MTCVTCCARVRELELLLPCLHLPSSTSAMRHDLQFATRPACATFLLATALGHDQCAPLTAAGN